MTIQKPDFSLERLHPSPVVGIDEAGCGPWAGPVVAGAFVFLQPHHVEESVLSLIRDSKQLSPARREKAYTRLTELATVRFGIGQASVEEIDHINIGQATRLAMQRAVSQLGLLPAAALVDGIRKPDLPCPITPVIKGDQISYSIAAASIIAKVTRDRIMAELDKDYPLYGWAKNAGYGTAHHQEALKRHGVTVHHRRSYAPISKLL
ncbi:MAG: ribonuclease [Alphaproteobacteria bacterium]|jgi:ribonuclease HII|nr:ribonuclease [Alphaproteobacteria bacterium]MDF3034684.1 ribonuclease [Alphaproteobacteria bacterium]